MIYVFWDWRGFELSMHSILYSELWVLITFSPLALHAAGSGGVLQVARLVVGSWGKLQDLDCEVQIGSLPSHTPNLRVVLLCLRNLYKDLFHFYLFVYATSVGVPVEARRRHWILWSWK